MKLEELVGKPITEAQFDEAAGKKDACYRKVKARYDVWPSAYASGALVKCRKVGAANWGNKSKKEDVEEGTCGYGIDGKLGEEPAGPNLRKKLKDISKHEEGVNEKKGDFLDSLFPKAKVDKAVKIAKSMGGNMTGAVKKIEKMFKGMSKHTKVKYALQQANESVNEAMSESQRFKVYNSLKRGDIVSIKYDSSIQKGSKYIPYVVTKGKTKLMKGKIERIILKSPKNPRFKAYLYNRDGDVSLALGDMAASIVDMKKGKVKESTDEGMNTVKVWSLDEKCWKGYEKKGMKTMFGKRYPNCVKKEGVQTNVWMGENELYYESNTGESGGYTFEYDNNDLNEAEYQGRKVKLGKIMQGDTKKFKVYVKNPKGNTVKVNFGQGGDAKGGTMRIRKSNPKARKSFRARHNCDNPGPRHKARYWSCRKW